MKEGIAQGTGRGWQCGCGYTHMTGTYCSVCNNCAPGCSSLFKEARRTDPEAERMRKALERVEKFAIAQGWDNPAHSFRGLVYAVQNALYFPTDLTFSAQADVSSGVEGHAVESSPTGNDQIPRNPSGHQLAGDGGAGSEQVTRKNMTIAGTQARPANETRPGPSDADGVSCAPNLNLNPSQVKDSDSSLTQRERCPNPLCQAGHVPAQDGMDRWTSTTCPDCHGSGLNPVQPKETPNDNP